MPIEDILAAHTAALSKHAAALEAHTAALYGAPQAAVAGAPRRGRPPASAPVPPADPVAGAKTAAPAATAPAVALKTVSDALLNLASAHGRQSVIDIFKQFGAAKLAEVKADDYPAVLAAVKAYTSKSATDLV